MLEFNDMLIPNGIEKIDPKISREIREGIYEYLEISVAKQVFNTHDSVLDIGSGIGFTALSLFEAGINKIHCIEANPDMVFYSKLLFSENGQDPGIVDNLAVSVAKTGQKIEFYIRDPLIASSIDEYSGSYLSRICVPSIRLDDAILLHGVTAILCDIEGAEAEIFADSKLPGIKKIVVEVHAHKSGIIKMGKMFKRLLDLGFAYDQWYSSGRVVAFRHESIYFDDYFNR